MKDVDSALVSALREQLAHRPAEARRVGWKVGRGDRERIGADIVVGHLTTATLLEPGAVYAATGGLHADAEIAVELADDETIAGYAAALELVDLGIQGDARTIVASNIFHRAVAFDEVRPTLPSPLEGRLVVNDVVRANARVDDDFAATVRWVARILGAVGERLQRGDRIITGSVVQVGVSPGDTVVADFGPLGRVGASIA